MMINKRDFWDKSLIIIQVLSLIIIPIILFIIGHNIEKALSDREVKAKYIEIAVSVLNQTPNQKTEALRNWALEVLQTYSEIKLSEDALEILKSTSLSHSYLTDESGNYIVDEKGNRIIIE